MFNCERCVSAFLKSCLKKLRKIAALKVLSNGAGGGPKLVSIDPF
jgi:hypothetical protein